MVLPDVIVLYLVYSFVAVLWMVLPDALGNSLHIRPEKKEKLKQSR